ncbi:MAG: YhcB family protein [Pseudohongiellaceae bacterium]
MIWLVAVGCLAVGIVIGVVFASRMNTSPSRVQELENQIRTLKESHGEYRDNVSDHFSMTAELVQHMTESYREVYQHLATGAQDLCPSEVASKLLPTDNDAVFEASATEEENSGLIPPKDYAAKQDPEQKGALSEEFGLDKPKTSADEE